jgi:hypothetical protein
MQQPQPSGRIEPSYGGGVTVSLPTFRKEGGCFMQVQSTASVNRAASLLTKHSPTITLLREKLGFQKDETVIAWLLEQVELCGNIDSTINKLLGQ